MFTTDYNTNLQIISDALRSEQSFDLVKRDLIIADRKAALFFIDGLLKDDITEKILEFFYKNVKSENFKSALYFAQSAVPYVEVEVTSDLKKICTDVLSGISALIIEDFTEVILLDTRTYPQRSTSEPDNDKVLRGSRDGFVETLINNTALIRRRIRDTNLTVKAYSVGTQSHTDIAVIYMENKVDKKLLANLDKRLKAIDVPSLTMNQQSLVEALYKNLWYNPFPKVKHTERPDTTASAILDGNIVILVDNAPSALLLPTSIFDVLEEADDYYFPPVTGTYLKLARYFITIVTVLITPLCLHCKIPTTAPSFFALYCLTNRRTFPYSGSLFLWRSELTDCGLPLSTLRTVLPHRLVLSAL